MSSPNTLTRLAVAIFIAGYVVLDYGGLFFSDHHPVVNTLLIMHTQDLRPARRLLDHFEAIRRALLELEQK